MPGIQDPETVFAKAEFLKMMVGVLPSQLWTRKLIGLQSGFRERLGGKDSDCLQIVNTSLDAICFDAATGLPQEIRYEEPTSGASSSIRYAIVLGDHRRESGILLPHVVTLMSREENKAIRVTKIATYAINGDVSLNRFKRTQR